MPKPVPPYLFIRWIYGGNKEDIRGNRPKYSESGALAGDLIVKKALSRLLTRPVVIENGMLPLNPIGINQVTELSLCLASRTLQRWRISGMIPYSRVSGKCYYKKSDILKLLNENYNG